MYGVGRTAHTFRAAREGEACPSDEALARAYGSHSPSRGRWLLSYMAERGVVVSETDFRGNRTVVVVATDWRTRASGGTSGLRSGERRGAARAARAGEVLRAELPKRR